MTDSITHIGAWTGRAALLQDKASLLARAKHIGLHEICPCVESQYDDTRGADFGPFASPRAFAELMRGYVGAGMTVNPLFYIQPTAEWLEDAKRWLGQVVETVKLPIASVELDWEEQITQAKVDQKVRDTISTEFIAFAKGLGLRVGVTGIVFANFDKMGAAKSHVDYATPMAYSSTIGNVAPGRAQSLGYDRWRPAFAADKEIVMGLAGYGQDGAGGLTASAAVSKAYTTAASKPGVKRIRVWSLEWLTASGAVGKFFQNACAQALRNRKPA